jgi:hypothetical protein
MYTEAVENAFCDTTASASCDTEGRVKILGLDFRFRQPVPDKNVQCVDEVVPSSNQDRKSKRRKANDTIRGTKRVQIIGDLKIESSNIVSVTVGSVKFARS